MYLLFVVIELPDWNALWFFVKKFHRTLYKTTVFCIYLSIYELQLTQNPVNFLPALLQKVFLLHYVYCYRPGLLAPA